MDIITVKNLCKTYKIYSERKGILGYLKSFFSLKFKEMKAVDNISFCIPKGQILGYLGENGAGKSTTIKMLTGVLTPTSGQVVVNGIIPYQERIKNNLNIGVVFGQKTQLWWDLPVIESFELIGYMYKMKKERYEENLAYMIETLELQELLPIQVKNLSLGQKMKCEIAAAFLHDPKVVYLDEPTIGLDILVKESIRDFIKLINKKYNTTIILTTHDMQDVEELCDRIILVDRGNMIYDGQIIEFKKLYTKENRLILTKKRDFIVHQANNYTILANDSKQVTLSYDPCEITPLELLNQIGNGDRVSDIDIQKGSLEQLLKSIYRGEHIGE